MARALRDPPGLDRGSTSIRSTVPILTTEATKEHEGNGWTQLYCLSVGSWTWTYKVFVKSADLRAIAVSPREFSEHREDSCTLETKIRG